MPEIVRSDTSSAGFTNDFHRLRDFLVRINQHELAAPGFLWGRWEWMFSPPYLDTSALARIGVWEQGGEIIAIVTYETDTGSAWLLTDSALAALKPAMLRYGAEAAGGRPCLRPPDGAQSSGQRSPTSVPTRRSTTP